MREVDGGNYSYTRGVKYPIEISEDTHFRLANFCQEECHTDGVFSVAPGVRLVLEDCNLQNVKVPDGAEIIGGNLAHVVRTETGGKVKPEVNLLCDCLKCASAVKELREAIDAGDLPKDASGKILHHEMKERYAARREYADLVEADTLDIEAENAAALAKWGG